MLFHSFSFLAFFAVVFAVYWSLPRHRWRMLWLLGASCAFYMSWNPWLITLIAASSSIDYVVALVLERTAGPRRRRLLLTLSVCGNLGFLVYFKYANFFLAGAAAALNRLGVPVGERTLAVVLPLGISFYTFEAVSYVVDVYRGRLRAVRNPLDYALYILFFPHLIAGPIVRPDEFLPQVARPKRWNWDRMQIGVQFFLIGVFKKAVLADHLAMVVDPVYADPAAWGTAAQWLAILAYMAQIYCDFSGYSDMAVGLGHMLGFKLPANFRQPYLAVSVTDFWRRWHMTLGRWLRDYVYIPLGGSRGRWWLAYCNLMITMVVCGLWHGAGWTWIAWGSYNGLLMCLERAAPAPRWAARPGWLALRVVATVLVTSVGMVFTRARNFGDALLILGRLWSPTAGQALEPTLAAVGVACLAAVAVGHLGAGLLDLRKLERRLSAPALAATLAGLLALSLLLLPEDGKAFIYFQF